jgi:hypothetical protein
MEGQDAPDHLAERPEAAVARVDTPVMPFISPGMLWRGSPKLIVRLRYTLGWQDTKNDGPCFVVVRVGAVTDKVLDRFPLTEEGWAQAWAALVQLDSVAAQTVAEIVRKSYASDTTRLAEHERQVQLYEAFVSAGPVTTFRVLGVQVLAGNGNVYTIGSHDDVTKTNSSRLLGPLAGAQAVVTDGSQAWSPGRAMFLPISLTGLATKTRADAAVVFPDGTVQIAPLDGNAAVREAQKQVVQFNALAGASELPAPETRSDPAVRLRKLQELRDAGLLTQEEYETKRADVINSI